MQTATPSGDPAPVRRKWVDGANQFLKEYQPLIAACVTLGGLLMAATAAYFSLKYELGRLADSVATLQRDMDSVKVTMATKQDLKDLRGELAQRLDGHAEAIRTIVSALKAKSIPVDEAAIGRHLARGTGITAWNRLLPPVVPGATGPVRDGSDLVYYAAEPASVLACEPGEVGRVTADSLEIVVQGAGGQLAAVSHTPAVGTLFARELDPGSVEVFRYRSSQMTILVRTGDRVERGQRIATLNGRPASAPAELRLTFLRGGKAVAPPDSIPQAH